MEKAEKKQQTFTLQYPRAHGRVDPSHAASPPAGRTLNPSIPLRVLFLYGLAGVSIMEFESLARSLARYGFLFFSLPPLNLLPSHSFFFSAGVTRHTHH